tara:strand:- start:956 stop:1186 length:231 start_codon:yes stop_codon:yes gene_type:complete
MSETTISYILSAFVLLIIFTAYLLIIFAGGHIMKAGEEQNNSNLKKAGKELSIAGNLLGMAIIFGLINGLMYLVAK